MAKHKKSELDKFYTDPLLAEQLIEKVMSAYDTQSNIIYIEPSAGNGSFSNLLPHNHIAFDIKPEHNNIQQQDWLSYDWKDINEKKFVIVIGNPPFGLSGSLALKFINKAAERADVIAFILPLSFKKDSILSRMPKNYILRTDLCGQRGITIPKDSFIINYTKYHVPCVFQIWEKTNHILLNCYKKNNSIISDIIEFTSKEQSDFRIQRVGGNAGKAFFNKDKALTSNYFVINKQKHNITNEELVKLINSLHYETIEYTTGPKSLSKKELINALNEGYKKWKDKYMG